MPEQCSVIGCNVKRHLFTVRDKWLPMNTVGWKSVKRLRICEYHFKQSDVCGDTKKFVRATGYPVYFTVSRYGNQFLGTELLYNSVCHNVRQKTFYFRAS